MLDPTARLSVHDRGRGEPTVVLVHGMGSSALEGFGPQIERFAPRFRVVAPDLPGHGASAACVMPSTVEGLAELLRARLVESGVSAPVIVGHSLGAMLAILLAGSSLAPRAVVAIDPPFLMPPELARGTEQMAAAVRGPGRETALRAFAEQSFFTPATPVRVRTRVLASLLAARAEALAAMFDAMARFDPESSLRAARGPLQYVLSAVPLDVARLRELQPSARIGSLAPAGHYSQLEQPEAVNAAIEAALRA